MRRLSRMADIAGRPALVLSKSGVRLEETTTVNAADSVIDVILNMNVGVKNQGGVIEFNGDITQTGRAAIRAEWGLLYSRRECCWSRVDRLRYSK